MHIGYAHVLFSGVPVTPDYHATKEFIEGVEIMKLTRSVDDGDRISYHGQPTVCILNTISSPSPTGVIFAGFEHHE